MTRGDYDVIDFGAVADGVTNNAAAIQAAIDACSAAGGGRVVVPAGGIHRSGSLRLRSHVELHIARGATLHCTGDWADITERSAEAAYQGYDADEVGTFLFAQDAVDIAITGPGTIDGAGRDYIESDRGTIYEMAVERPFMLFFIDCSDVTLRDTTYFDGAFWNVRLTGCERVLIDGIRIEGDWKVPNGDGIDLDRCRDVRVANCHIHSPDDAIALHSTEEFPGSGACENIVITNCVLQSRSSAVVIGALNDGPVRNVVVQGCVIKTSHRGLSVNLSQWGDYDNFLFSDIVVETQLEPEDWWGRGEPIYVGAAPWTEGLGVARNIRFSNILARGENGIYVEAVEAGHLDGIHFDRVRIEVDKWTDEPGGRYDRRPYSGADALYEHPTAGFYIRRATNVTLRDCEVSWGANRQPYWGSDIDAEDAPGLVIERSGQRPRETNPANTA